MTKPKPKSKVNTDVTCMYCGGVKASLVVCRAHEQNCWSNPRVKELDELKYISESLGKVIDDQAHGLIQLQKDKWLHRVSGMALATGIALHYAPPVEWFSLLLLSLVLWWILQKISEKVIRGWHRA